MKPLTRTTFATPPGSASGACIHTVKEMARALGRSEDYVGFMKRGGFKLPATLGEAEAFIRDKGPVTRFRLYGHRPKR